MRSLTKTELVLAQNICERFEEIGMFDSENGYDEPEEYYDNVDCYTGATRMCFITDELPGWVIKVNFKGIKFDYCKREAENYADALSKGLEGYFASTYKVYECADGRVVTVQEEVVVDEPEVEEEPDQITASEHAAQLIDDIRKKALRAMADLADTPEDENYIMLKKVWQMTDRKPEQQQQNQQQPGMKPMQPAQ